MTTVTGTRTGDLSMGLQLRLGRPLLRMIARGDAFGTLLLGTDDPRAVYDAVRAAGPLYRSRLDAYVTASHPLGSRILRDRSLRLCRRDGRPPGRETMDKIGWDGSILGLDPPDHTRMRRLAQPAFTPRKIEQYRVAVERVCHGLLDEAEARGRFDLVADYAGPLPIAVIGELLGARESDHPVLRTHGRTIGSIIDGVGSLRMAREFDVAHRAYLDLFRELIAVRRACPADDLISTLAAAEDGGVVTEQELLALCVVLAVTGFETTTNLIGNAVLALLTHPGQWAMLRDDPSLGPRVVEETLRYDSPALQGTRIPHEDTEIGGIVVPADRAVVVLLAAANHDPDVYARPDRFDVLREGEPEHLSFSGGIHYCIGAPLARMEADVALRVLARRMPDLRPDGPRTRRASPVISGLHTFPVASS